MSWFKIIKILAIVKEIYAMVVAMGDSINTEALADALDTVIDTLQAIVAKLDPENKYHIMEKLDWMEEKWGDPSD